MSPTDELNLFNHEIDKQITRRTNEILELIKQYLGGIIDGREFHMKMIDNGNISINDLILISKKLIKRHKFEANPNQRDFMRMKQLSFATTSQDIGELNLESFLMGFVSTDKTFFWGEISQNSILFSI